MTHGSLYSGIGGWLLAARWAGIENIFTCEINDFCNKVLSKHFKVEQHRDIKETDFTGYAGRVDILTTSDPCQPFSFAGKRGGKGDDRYLWPETVRAIREVKPSYVVFENVLGLLSMEDGKTLEGILISLENEGYIIEPPLILPALGASAVHRRDRLWVLGYITNPYHNGCSGNKILTQGWKKGREAFNESYSCINAIRNKQITEFNRKYNGVSSELDKNRIKALGNSIVPQIAFLIFEAIKQVKALKE